MSTIKPWLEELAARDIRFAVEGDKLRINAPKGAVTPELAGELSRRKGEILAYLQGNASIPPVLRDGDLPLSFAQQRLWFMDQLEKDSAAYNMPSALRLTGALDRGALERSLSEIVRRHEVLRTSYTLCDGSPVQHIHAPADLRLSVVDLSHLGAAEQAQTVRRLADAEALRPFSLEAAPLLRGTLLMLAPEEHVLLMTMHHIVSDGWSIGVIGRELSLLYEAFMQGKPSPLPELSIQYADFAAWQNAWLQGEGYQAQLAHWQRRLQGAPTVLELDTDRPRPPVQSYGGATEVVRIDAGMRGQLVALGRESGATLFMTLLAGFAVLLRRYTGHDDLIVGTPIANRNRPEVEALVGFFANTLPLRCDLTGDPDFRTLLRRVQGVTVEAYENQDIPFEKIVEELNVPRDLSRNPLVQVVFVLQNAPMHASGSSTAGLKGLAIEPVPFDTGTVRLDMEVHCWEERGGLKVEFVYNTDLFDAASIARMAANYLTVLESALADPACRVSQMPLLSQAERRLLAAWNDTARPTTRDRCIHQYVADHAARTPDAVALACDGEYLSYAQLNRRANQLARRLQGMGVGPDVPVAICVERSLEMVVGLLAILKAGGAYVPIDPTYPRERVLFLLGDSSAALLITQAAIFNEEAVAAMHIRSPILFLDQDKALIDAEAADEVATPVTAENLAYIIYTSGSTGTPKGVQIRHRTLINLLEGVHPRLGISAADVWTVFHSYSFDLSVWEIWSPLFSGGKLVVVPYRMTQDAAEFRQMLTSERVTVLNQTPSFMRQLLQLEGFGKEAPALALRLVICGGEALPQELAEQLLERQFTVWNFYGPTEATVWTVINPVTQAASPKGIVPIGAPIANARVYILDAALQPVPIGVKGELHIGGECLALGYFKRPELTAEKFIPDPFSEQAGARLYKTGDLARWLPSGEIEYLGRADFQVKVRGFRIELGEIESAIAAYPGISENVVVVREDTPGDQRLSAYLVCDPAISLDELRRHLRERLPFYMVPLAFVALEKLPLTPNGKIDRKHLPLPGEASLLARAGEASQPRSDTEEKIAAVWREALRLDSIGIHDNFFDAGGYSFLLVKVCNALREVFDRDIKVVDLFQYPTIASFAAFVANDGASGVTDFDDLEERAAKRKQMLEARRRDR
ncbi:MAG: amino acid adenylation domain-containing protein [Sulfuricella sp.]|nr:amino acid adenylation domain-containing protein [Sulfuricella sp.]